MIRVRLLNRIQTHLETFLTSSCTIEAETDSVGPYGEPTHGWSVVAEDVACRVIDARKTGGSASTEVGGQEAMVDTFRLIVAAGTALAVDQRVTVGSDVYQVVALVTSRTDGADGQAVITRVRD